VNTTHGAPRRTPKGARPVTRNTARARLDPSRQVALRALCAVAEQDAYANLVLPRLLREAELTGRDAGFTTELTYGTLRGRGTYDAVLAACSARPIGEIDPPLLDALRLGAHQLLAMRVPAHAGVAATVDLVRAEIGQGAAGFANAVLRRVAEADLEAWLAQVTPRGASEDARLALRHSHPEWMVRALRDALRHHGRDVAELADLLAADNAAPPVTLAALPGLADPATLGPSAGPLSPYAVTVTGAPGDLPAVRRGRARVQDAGSQAVTLALADVPLNGHDGGDLGRWLDLCAGPGGKSALLGALLLQRRRAGALPAGAHLVATEITEHRAQLVRAGVAGVVDAAAAAGEPEVVAVHTADGCHLDDAGLRPAEGYDRVLVDAPCTGLGALRRRPEARWRRTPSDLATLAPLQRDLLRAALDVVRPGGVVGYVTCSPHPAETTTVVADVLRARGDVERIGPDRQLWPHLDGCDAMYLALLRRVASSRP
jgi:16S rRNA (cytosine967-C5)-methyltransferase